ncbi:MerC family mercury resistance protein [Flavobacterium sp. Sr18]|uniref:MerC family mercury resistance protein n=1 Tax=Flavobacterium sp. Sr18 TaxID=935222 RepID=UPI0013E4E7DF|nr:MerC family mercury resistance protein [Flavobacterium sp. Sr18]MDD2675059.1 MerC family mercury resistance protein [Flavobacterium sp.]QIH39047.1 MerC family mercury resistance protein [Flavobacterium sp. Sr18]
MKKTTSLKMDILGISSAGLCLLHCLIFPLLTILPLGLSHNPYIDLAFATVGLWAVLNIIKKASLIVALLLLTSITLIFLSVFIDIFLDYHTNLLIVGGIGMILGHLINYSNHKNTH